MTTCRQGVRLLADYMEGLLAGSTRRTLDRHVAGCRRCQGFVRSYAATPGILRGATRTTIPAAVRRSLRVRLAKERRS
jgi:anti-sigma factor RsiW